MKTVTYTCIVCPKSCDITVTDEDGKLSFAGYGCKRGLEHAENEYLHPARMLTTTVKVVGGEFARLGVAGTCEVPKARLRECLKAVYSLSVNAPVKAGDILIKDLLGTGCDVVAAMTVEKK